MTSYLDRIVEDTLGRVQQAKSLRPMDDLLRSAAAAEVFPRGFNEAMRTHRPALIAEFKRRSPSAGPIGESEDPASVAAEYESGGAAAMSVLTEPNFFGGSAEDLQNARVACSLPVLRKDFIVDAYQVAESLWMGADAVLIIVAAFSETESLKALYEHALASGLGVLLEVHDREELRVALELEPAVVGINQRNLRTFEVDVELAAKLRASVPPEVITIAESGIKTPSDVQRLVDSGVDGFLVGESLMRSPDKAAAVRDLLTLAG